MTALALILASWLTLAAGVVLLMRSTHKCEPTAVLWICDQCGTLARAESTPQGVLDVQAIRKAHDCIGAADLVREVEQFAASQAPPP